MPPLVKDVATCVLVEHDDPPGEGQQVDDGRAEHVAATALNCELGRHGGPGEDVTA